MQAYVNRYIFSAGVGVNVKVSRDLCGLLWVLLPAPNLGRILWEVCASIIMRL